MPRLGRALPLLFALAHCSPADPGDPPRAQTQTCASVAALPAGPPPVVVGRGGAATFEPLAAGAVLPLQHGFQGGTHVYVDVLFHAEAVKTWTLTTHLTRSDGTEETDSSTLTACVGWNRAENVRFVLLRGGGEGTLDVTATSVDTPPLTLKSTPLAVTIR